MGRTVSKLDNCCEMLVDLEVAAASANAVSVRSDGRIYLAGSFSYTCGSCCGPSCGTSFAVSRLTDSGALDSTFDADGKLSTTFTGASIEGINATAITPDGKFLAAGQVMSSTCCGTSDFGLSRYNAPSGLEERRFVEHDANYNITSVSDVFGEVVERYEETPYGTVAYLNANFTSRGSSGIGWVYLHQGGRWDAVLGGFYFRNRDYSPSLQRWLSTDPMGYVDGMNEYQPERMDPVGSNDPYGLETIKVGAPVRFIESDDIDLTGRFLAQLRVGGEHALLRFDYKYDVEHNYLRRAEEPKSPILVFPIPAGAGDGFGCPIHLDLETGERFAIRNGKGDLISMFFDDYVNVEFEGELRSKVSPCPTYFEGDVSVTLHGRASLNGDVGEQRPTTVTEHVSNVKNRNDIDPEPVGVFHASKEQQIHVGKQSFGIPWTPLQLNVDFVDVTYKIDIDGQLYKKLGD